MSVEQRDVRPFVVPYSLEGLFSHATLRYGMHSIEPGARVVLEEHEFVNSPVRLVMAKGGPQLEAAVAAAHEGLRALDVTVDQLNFAVVLQSSFLKIMDVVVDVPLEDFVRDGSTLELSGPPRPAAFRTPRSGCTVEALLYFNEERPRRARQPWRFGTWLARATFEVVTDLAFTGFTPLPLTAAIKADKGLSPKTARYVSLGGVSPFEIGVTEDAIEVWCDADLLAKMSANGKASGSAGLQRQLFVDAIGAIVMAAIAEGSALANSVWSDVEDSLLGRAIAVVAPARTNESQRLAACNAYLAMIKNDPARFMTYAEEAVGLLAAYDDFIEG